MLGTYNYDVVYIDALGNQAHVVPASYFSVRTSQYISGQPVTVPPEQQPLAQGPAGPPGPTGPQGTQGPPGPIGQVARNGVLLPQRSVLNIISPLNASDDSADGYSNVFLDPSGVAAGSYSSVNLTVDAFGRITAASNGGGGGTVTEVDTSPRLTGGPITSSGTLDLAVSGVSAGSFTNADITVDVYGRITAASSGAPGGVTSLTAQNGITGNATTGDVSIGLTSTGVADGSYGTASQVGSFTVDAYGRLSSASNTGIQIAEAQVTNLTSDLASKVPNTRAVNTNARLTGGGDLSSDLALDLNTSGISAGTFQGITFDAYGRATSAVNAGYGTGTVTSVATTSRLTGGTITTSGTFDLATSGVAANSYGIGNGSFTFDAYGRATAATAPTNLVTSARAVLTTAPLSGGGDLSTDRTLSIPKADATHDGYLSQADWSVFNGKLSSAVTSITASAPLTGGTITSTGSIGIPKAGASADGYLSQTDWNTFNNKLSSAVTSVATTSRLTGGPIITTGTLDLATSGVVAGTFTFGNGSVVADAYGRITSASSATNLVTGTAYQTIKFGGAALAQQNTINFAGRFNVVDDPTDGYTFVDLPAKGTQGTYSFGNGSITFDAYGRANAQTSATNIITGSIASTQIAYGDTASGTIKGSANLTYDGTNVTVAGSYFGNALDRTSSGALNIGTANATSMTIGSSALTTAPIFNTGTGTTYTFRFNGTDNLVISSSIFQFKGVANAVANIGTSTTADTAGFNFTVNAGTASAASTANGKNGGQLFANGGTAAAASGSFTAGQGGNATFQGGTGGAGTASLTSGAGGNAILQGGVPGTNNGGGQGVGGGLFIRGGAGSTNGAVTIGDTNTANVSIGAVGINVFIPGGAVRAATAAAHTTGVDLTFGQGTGGATGTNTSAGAGGQAILRSGQGGAATVGTGETAGSGGAATVVGGQGGTGFTSVNGPGAGGNAQVFGGPGGTVSGGFSGSNGGNVIIRGGALSGTGTNGTITIGDSNTSAIGIGNSAAALTLSSPTINIPANTVFSAAASATNTTAVSFTPNVADGASSVVFDINNTTTLSNASALLFRLRNNGNSVLNTKLNSSDGFTFTDSGGSASLSLSTNLGSVLAYSSATLSAGAGSVTMNDGTGSLSLSGGTVSCTVFSVNPDADNTRTIGTKSLRWAGVFNSAQISGGYRSASSTVTVTTTDWFVGVSGSGSRTVNLPAANTVPAGFFLYIQEIGGSAGTITINRNGSDTINGATTTTITAAYGRKEFICNGSTAWFVNTGVA